ncbi:MAG: hypothetical protein LUD52_03380, partial [Opitutae bacterium]|nr:hypothetical protein [Opitutae bacterium]
SNATNTATLTLNGTSITPNYYVTTDSSQTVSGRKTFVSRGSGMIEIGETVEDSGTTAIELKNGSIISCGSVAGCAGSVYSSGIAWFSGLGIGNSQPIESDYTSGEKTTLVRVYGDAGWTTSVEIRNADNTATLTLNDVEVGAKLSELESRIAALEAKLG